jgi:hypothetical protein
LRRGERQFAFEHFGLGWQLKSVRSFPAILSAIRLSQERTMRVVDLSAVRVAESFSFCGGENYFLQSGYNFKNNESKMR